VAALALAAYANKDELMETGAIDPLKQGQKTKEGLGKLFSLDDDLLSMNRLHGGIDAVTGTVGTVLGGITTGGKAVYKGMTGGDASNPLSDAVEKSLGSGFAHGAIDSIVGLFGGETDAVRAKKSKELDEKLQKAINERKIERENRAGVAQTETTSAIVSPAEMGLSQSVSENLKAKEQNQQAMDLLKEGDKRKIVIEQPKDKPIPVMLTDDKGEPLVTSADRQASVADNNQSSSQEKNDNNAAEAPTIIPDVTTGTQQLQAAPVVIAPPYTPMAQALDVPATDGVKPDQRNAFARGAGAIASGGVAVATAAAKGVGSGINAMGAPEVMSAITHQQNAYTTSNFRGSPMVRSQQAAVVADQAIAQSQPAPVTPAVKPAYEFRPVSVDRMAALKDADVEQASRLHKAATQPLADYDTPLPDAVKQMRIKTSKGTKTAEELGIKTFGELQSKGGQAFSGGYNDPATTYATALIQKEMGDNFNRVTAQNDQYHQKHSPNSGHTKGTKTDFTVKNMSYDDAHKKTADIMAKHGLEEGKDFKIISKTHGTGDHIDFKLLPSGQAKMQNVMAKESSPSATSVIANTAQAIPAMLGAHGVPGAAAVAGAMQNAQSGWKIGQTSKKYEVGKGGGAGTVSTGKGDAGGVSYGTYQMSTTRGVADKFVRQSAWADEFKGMKAGTSEFSNKWKEIAKNDPTFGDAQHEYIKKTHYAPLDRKLKKDSIDLSARGPAVQDMIWSTGVQFGGGSSVITNALKGKDVSKMSDADIVTAVQDYKAANTASLFKSSPTQHAGLTRRAKEEKESLLKLASDSAIANVTSAPYDPMAQALDVPVTEDMMKNMTPEQRNVFARGAGAIARGGLHVLTQGARDTGTMMNDMGAPEVMSAITHQQNAYTTSNFRGYRDRRTGEQATPSRDDRGQRSDGIINTKGMSALQSREHLEKMTRELSDRTFTGSVPPAEHIPPVEPKPEYIRDESNRNRENWDLLNQPNVKGVVDALAAAGINISGGKLDSKNIPDNVLSEMSTVDVLRKSGAFKDMMDGNLSDVFAKVAPGVPITTGLQNAFTKGSEKLSPIMSGDRMAALKDEALGQISSISKTTSDLIPTMGGVSNDLANVGFQEMSAERSADSKAISEAIPQSPVIGSSGANSGMGRGGNLLNKSDEPILVRNPESAIRELTKLVVGFSFG
jgi:hypothetical protein